jgi:GPH family glycoside/pentoside/hexuronide:cation symporter
VLERPAEGGRAGRTPRSPGRRAGAPSGENGGPLSRRARALDASSSLGGEALTQSRGAWLVYYYAPPADAGREALLPLGLAGALVFAASLLEALDDPLIGYWSDRTRSRLGRRLPFILAATPPWALFAVLLFTPPADAGTALTGAYLFLALELYHLFSTLSGGPYESLLPEIARTSAERLSIVGMRVYFGAAGGVVGVAGSGLLVDRVGFRAMALAMASVALACRFLGTVGVWRRARLSREPAAIPPRASLRATCSNRHFLLFLPTFVLFQVGLQLLLGALPYYARVLLGTEREGLWVAIASGSAIAVTLATVPVFVRVARRTSTRIAYARAMAGAAAVFPLLGSVGLVPGIPAQAELVLIMALAGAPIAGIYLFPAALMAAIVDEDYLRTGLRREASYFGTQSLVEKAATSLSPLLLASLLLLGNSAEDTLGIRLVGPAAGLVVLAGYLVFRRYDLPDDVLAAGRPAEPGAG